MNTMKTGMILSATVAALFASAAFADDMSQGMSASTGKVKCMGVNSCKGTGACKTATNSCSGKNACKGKGWSEMTSEKECTDKGGKVVQE